MSAAFAKRKCTSGTIPPTTPDHAEVVDEEAERRLEAVRDKETG
jgi:hypothetical protein